MTRATAFIVTPAGMPAVCQLSVRESTTAPNRLKVGFVADLEEGSQVMATGAAAEQMGELSPLPEGAVGTGFISPEFRLEMN
jgi:hypothetical protein